MKAFEIKRAIFKLRQRTLQTAKLNSKFRALELKRNQIYLQACFVKAWKYSWQVDKRMA